MGHCTCRDLSRPNGVTLFVEISAPSVAALLNGQTVRFLYLAVDLPRRPSQQVELQIFVAGIPF